MAFLRAILLLVSIFVLARSQSYNTEHKVFAGMEVTCDDVQLRVYFNSTKLSERTTSDTDRPYKINFDGQTSQECGADETKILTESTFDSETTFNSFIKLAAAPNECGINVYEEGNYIVYNQTIIVTYGENPNDKVIREEYDHYNVKCLVNKTVAGDFKDVNATIRETGLDAKNSTTEFKFSFTHTNLADVTPAEYEVGQKIKFKVLFDSNLSMLKSVIQKCWATSDGSNDEYKLIDNRCTSDAGSAFLGSYQAKSQTFTTQAFQYKGQTSKGLFVECLVRVCKSDDSTSTCSPCRGKDDKVLPSFARKRREIQTSSSSQLELVRSPVFYVVDAKDLPKSKENQSKSIMEGTNGTIIIVLLALLVFVAVVAIIKKSFFSSPSFQLPTVSVKGIDNKGLA